MSRQSCCLSRIGTVLSPDISAPQRHPSLYRHPRYCAEGIPLLPRVLCRRSFRTYLQKLRIRVWMSYRTFRSPGYGYKTHTELTEVPGIVTRAYRTHRSAGRVEILCTGTPGIVKQGVHNLRKFSVGNLGRTELTEVLCRVFPGKYTGSMVLRTEPNLQNLTKYIRRFDSLRYLQNHIPVVFTRAIPYRELM